LTKGDGLVEWIEDLGPDPIPADLLHRIMYLGTPTTLPDGSHVSVIPDGPQAHLAIQGSKTRELSPHFHGVEQFQLFVKGGGTVGRHQVRTGVVHYSDRFTVYGPLRAGAEGMSYATLRGQHDTGAHFMPDSRSELADLLAASARSARDRRNVTVDLTSSAGDPAPGWRDLLSDSDGLRISVQQLGAAEASTAVTIGGAGAYTTVVAGTVMDGDAPRRAGAISWHDPGASFATIAGDAGARIALLQFPRL
jgi:hypothetical protein